jgi:hypothetical protein
MDKEKGKSFIVHGAHEEPRGENGKKHMDETKVWLKNLVRDRV